MEKGPKRLLQKGRQTNVSGQGDDKNTGLAKSTASPHQAGSTIVHLVHLVGLGWTLRAAIATTEG